MSLQILEIQREQTTPEPLSNALSSCFCSCSHASVSVSLSFLFCVSLSLSLSLLSQFLLLLNCILFILLDIPSYRCCRSIHRSRRGAESERQHTTQSGLWNQNLICDHPLACVTRVPVIPLRQCNCLSSPLTQVTYGSCDFIYCHPE